MEKIVRKAQNFLETDINYLAKGGFWLTLGKVISIVSALATSIVFANFLPETTYGIFRYALSIGAILAIVTLRGIDTSLSRAVAQGEEGLMSQAFKTKMKWGLLATLAGLAGSVYYYINENVELSLILLISAIFIPLMEASYVYIGYLNGKKFFDKTIKSHLAEKAVVTIALILLAIYSKNVVLIILGYYISYSLVRFLFFKKVETDQEEKNNDDTSFLGFGKHLSVIGMLKEISVYLDKILVFHYIGAAPLAGYYLALMPFKQIQNIFGSLKTLALPKFATSEVSHLQKTLPSKFLKLYLLIVPTIIIYWLAAPHLFSWIYPLYTDYVFISQIFVLQLLLLPTIILTTALTSLGKKKELYITSAIYSIFRIVALLILTPVYGVWGAVITILATNTINTASTTYIFFKKTK